MLFVGCLVDEVIKTIERHRLNETTVFLIASKWQMEVMIRIAALDQRKDVFECVDLPPLVYNLPVESQEVLRAAAVGVKDADLFHGRHSDTDFDFNP